MAKTALVEKDVKDGAALVGELDKAGFPVQAALWLFSSQNADWRFVIATNELDREGPKGTYKSIQRILREATTQAKTLVEFGISLQDIALTSPSSPLIQQLRVFFRTGNKAIGNMRIRACMIGNQFVEEAHIYRNA